MRRKERAVTDTDKIRAVIEACDRCRLGLNDNGKVYIVPLNFGYTETDGRYTLYFHGARQGRKIELINRVHYAGFEMDTDYRLQIGENACTCTAYFQSIIGAGQVSFVEEAEEKRTALAAIMRHNTGRDNWEFSEQALSAVCVFRLEVEELSCKAHF